MPATSRERNYVWMARHRTSVGNYHLWSLCGHHVAFRLRRTVSTIVEPGTSFVRPLRSGGVCARSRQGRRQGYEQWDRSSCRRFCAAYRKPYASNYRHASYMSFRKFVPKLPKPGSLPFRATPIWLSLPCNLRSPTAEALCVGAFLNPAITIMMQVIQCRNEPSFRQMTTTGH